MKEAPMRSSDAHNSPTKVPTLATLLAVTSAGLGATELLAPTLVAKVGGIEPTRRGRRVIRALGARELAHGIAVHSSPALVWTRVAGDILDVALLAVGHRQHSASARRGIVTASLLTEIAGLDAIATRRYVGTGRG
jgi:hypothetical protein